MIKLNKEYTIESFPDWEMVLYNQNNKMTHILNKSAAHIINLLNYSNCEDTKMQFVILNQNLYSDYSDCFESILKEDFDQMLAKLIELNIVFREVQNDTM